MIIKIFFLIITLISCDFQDSINENNDIIVSPNPYESKLLRPRFNEIVNSTHVLFEWRQQQFADSYIIEVCKNNDFTNCQINESSSSLIKIIKTNLEWNNLYFWRVKSISSSNPIDNWIDSSQFQISEKLGDAYTNFSNNNLEDNITIYGSFFDFYSAAIDAAGNEIWNSGHSQFVFYSNNQWGQFFGSQYSPNLENNLPGVEFNYENDIIWREPNEHFMHHEIIQLPSGNYIGIVEESRGGPIPNNGDWVQLFQGIGYVADGETVEFRWVGDRIVEWDYESGSEVWSWSTFDNFSMNDYDVNGGTWMEAYQAGRYDWTHANALAFDVDENAIYISSRHLSRISKIAYPSGDLLWNMGIELGSGEVNFGENLQFSFQHSLQILPNRNIVILDNGNLSQSLFGTDYPTSRGLEIQINGNESAEIIWEYILPQNLFGFASGNVQKLANNNYLITTVGDGGTSLEINSEKEIVWEGKYNLTLPAGAVYRAQRINGFFAGNFSLILPKEIDFSENILYGSLIGNELKFSIVNESNYNELFQFDISSPENFIATQSLELELAPQQTEKVQIPVNQIESKDITFTVSVTPIHFPHLEKSHEIQILYEDLHLIKSQNNILEK